MNNEYHFFYKSKLSQWHIVDFTDKNGVQYNCCEQYMMYQKAMLFKDEETGLKILNEKNPYNHQQLGRLVKNYNQTLWDESKYGIVYDGNYLRFTQSKPCWELLDATGTKMLVEASPVDKVWGIGLGIDDPDRLDPAKWKGQNLLGKVLSHVRGEIRKL